MSSKEKRKREKMLIVVFDEFVYDKVKQCTVGIYRSRLCGLTRYAPTKLFDDNSNQEAVAQKVKN